MKIIPRVALLWVLFVLPLRAADTESAGGDVAAVKAADDERVAATIAADRVRLEAIYSDELRYGHSNGAVDTKTSYIDSVVSHRSIYGTYDYESRTFLPAAPGVVLMTGRVLIQSGGKEHPTLLDLNFLGVWRKEGGTWRFLSWQSCHHPPAATQPVPAK